MNADNPKATTSSIANNDMVNSSSTINHSSTITDQELPKIIDNSNETETLQRSSPLSSVESQKIITKVIKNAHSDSKEILIKKLPDCRFSVGQLAWAQIGNYPYWPCVVMIDKTSKTHAKYRNNSLPRSILVHVQYFGDNCSHGWVNQNAIIPFTGLADFCTLAKKSNRKLKIQNGPPIDLFCAKPRIRRQWETGIYEATEVMPMTNSQRAEHFKPKEKDMMHEELLKELRTSGSRKRAKHSMDSKKAAVKRIKRKVDWKKEADTRILTDTPPTPPAEKSQIEILVERITSKAKTKKVTPTVIQPNESSNKPDRKQDKQNSREKRKSPEVRSNELSTNIKLNDSSIQSKSIHAEKLKSNTTEKARTLIENSAMTPYNLFLGKKLERVCQLCEKPGNLTRCKGPCFSWFHLSCVKPGEKRANVVTMEDENSGNIRTSTNGDKDNGSQKEKNFKCTDCISGDAPACIICKKREEERLRCSAYACGRYYHVSCLKLWPQSLIQGDRLTCPYHMCHTCNSHNPKNATSWSSNNKLVRCVRCPSSYHPSTSCVPAGTEILTGSQIVCPKHCKPPGPPINAAWCFSCTQGGSLICCDTCPRSFHPECLGIKTPVGGFICKDCTIGRMPLYGEVVWVKLGTSRWWPSRICFPREVPENLEIMRHRMGEFCVMFLGTTNYCWIHRGRAFVYQDDDPSVQVMSNVENPNVDRAFPKALELACKIHRSLRMERVEQNDSSSQILSPPSYVQLSVNVLVGNVKRVDEEIIAACNCDPISENPCAADTDCFNRISSVECNPDVCPAGTKCNNQKFVRRQYPLMEFFHTVERGWALRTLEFINEGQFVIEYVGEIIDETEYKERLYHKLERKDENFYFLRMDETRIVDAESKGNLSRFMNHSCIPNCESKKWKVNGDTRIGLFALRDIKINEELTFGYNLASDRETQKVCLCRASNCSGFIGLKAQSQEHDAVKIIKA